MCQTVSNMFLYFSFGFVSCIFNTLIAKWIIAMCILLLSLCMFFFYFRHWNSLKAKHLLSTQVNKKIRRHFSSASSMAATWCATRISSKIFDSLCTYQVLFEMEILFLLLSTFSGQFPCDLKNVFSNCPAHPIPDEYFCRNDFTRLCLQFAWPLRRSAFIEMRTEQQKKKWNTMIVWRVNRKANRFRSHTISRQTKQQQQQKNTQQRTVKSVLTSSWNFWVCFWFDFSYGNTQRFSQKHINRLIHWVAIT